MSIVNFNEIRFNMLYPGASPAQILVIHDDAGAILSASNLDHNEEDNTLELIMTFNDVTKPDSTKYEAYAIANDIIKKINEGYQVVEKGKDGLVSRKCEFKDFCILTSRSNTFNDYYTIFNEFNIPLYIEKNLNIVSNDLVAILFSLLKIVKNIKSNTCDSLEFKHAFISLARSFVYQYSDEKIYLLTGSPLHLV